MKFHSSCLTESFLILSIDQGQEHLAADLFLSLNPAVDPSSHHQDPSSFQSQAQAHDHALDLSSFFKLQQEMFLLACEKGSLPLARFFLYYTPKASLTQTLTQSVPSLASRFPQLSFFERLVGRFLHPKPSLPMNVFHQGLLSTVRHGHTSMTLDLLNDHACTCSSSDHSLLIESVFIQSCQSGRMDLIHFLFNPSKAPFSSNIHLQTSSGTRWASQDMIASLLIEGVNYSIVYQQPEVFDFFRHSPTLQSFHLNPEMVKQAPYSSALRQSTTSIHQEANPLYFCFQQGRVEFLKKLFHDPLYRDFWLDSFLKAESGRLHGVEFLLQSSLHNLDRDQKSLLHWLVVDFGLSENHPCIYSFRQTWPWFDSLFLERQARDDYQFLTTALAPKSDSDPDSLESFADPQTLGSSLNESRLSSKPQPRRL